MCCFAGITEIDGTNEFDELSSRLDSVSRNVIVLRTDVLDLQVNLRTERRITKKLERQLSQIMSDNSTTHASSSQDKTPDGMLQIMKDLQSVRAKYGELEGRFERLHTHCNGRIAVFKNAISAEKRKSLLQTRRLESNIEDLTTRIDNVVEDTTDHVIVNFQQDIRDVNTSAMSAVNSLNDSMLAKEQTQKTDLAEWRVVILRVEEQHHRFSDSVCCMIPRDTHTNCTVIKGRLQNPLLHSLY
jgi:hypothetical protein